MDCIIQIITKNETLLNKIGESIDIKKIEHDKSLPKTKDSSYKRYLAYSDLNIGSDKNIKNVIQARGSLI